MRTLSLLVVTAAALAGAGCESLKGASASRAPARTGAIPEIQPDVIVNYLNQQSAAIQSVEFDKVKASTSSGSLIQQAVSVEGDLYCAKPRMFRMRAGLKLSPEELDVGSNAQYFWMYVKRAQDPNFVFCSHDDYAAGKVNLPIPFDPEWVLQALGMTTYDPSAKYTVQTRQREREYALEYEGKTPQGVPVRKITILAADPATSESTPYVKKHIIQDQRGNVIAAAEILKVKRAQGLTDPSTGQPVVVLIPTHINLTFQGGPEKLKLNLTLENETVNGPSDERKQKYLYTLPKINGSNPINLAEYRVSPTARGQSPGRSRRE